MTFNAVDTFSYCQGDKETDVLRYHYSQETPSKTQLFLANKGIQFEELVYRDLQRKESIPIRTIDRTVTPATLKLTRDAIRERIPILHQVPLYHRDTDVKGVADFLIRADKVRTYFPSVSSSNTLETGYVVLDVKFRTFHLCKDGETPRRFPELDGYLSQLWSYTLALAEIEHREPNPYAYLIGRRYRQGEKKWNRYDDRLVTAVFTPELKQKHQNALAWLSTVASHESDSRSLTPNMKILSNGSSLKQNIAKKNGEITLLWQCGIREREKAFSQGVFSIYDTRLTAEMMGLKNHRATVVNQILQAQREDTPPLIAGTPLVLPASTSKEYFIDFETIPEPFLDDCTSLDANLRSHLFLVGIGWECEGAWRYRAFVSNTLTLKEESRMVQQVASFIEPNATVYHWGHIEYTTWKRFSVDTEWNWVDLSKIFLDTPITIQGAYNFGLKTIAQSMYDHQWIETCWKEEMNGVDCVVEAVTHYQEHPEECFTRIYDYNIVDCRVLWEILTFLRTRFAENV